jgi:hypothetical protein
MSRSKKRMQRMRRPLQRAGSPSAHDSWQQRLQPLARKKRYARAWAGSRGWETVY